MAFDRLSAIANKGCLHSVYHFAHELIGSRAGARSSERKQHARMDVDVAPRAFEAAQLSSLAPQDLRSVVLWVVSEKKYDTPGSVI